MSQPQAAALLFMPFLGILFAIAAIGGEELRPRWRVSLGIVAALLIMPSLVRMWIVGVFG